jgi:hypothetical protein
MREERGKKGGEEDVHTMMKWEGKDKAKREGWIM